MQLSVVICTWNRAEKLRLALESVDRCTVPPGTDWEILLIDNNSTDDTKAVCQGFVEKRPGRFRYLLEKRQGKSFALNTAIANARGAIIAFTDDDITVDSGWLRELLKVFEHSCLASAET
jgi:glycosyltransferase involved in cell wall biosynthesis